MIRALFSRLRSTHRHMELKFSFFNISFFLLIIFILFIFIYTTTARVGKTVSRDYAELYSFKTAAALNKYLIKDIHVLQNIIRTQAVQEWFLDENDPEKKALAFAEFKKIGRELYHETLYMAFPNSRRQYVYTKGIVLEEFYSKAHLDITNVEDSWYYEVARSENLYELNVDTDKVLRHTLLWINHKILSADGELIGVICTGVPFGHILNGIFDSYDVKNIRGIVINSSGFVQMDSAADKDILVDDSTLHFKELVKNPVVHAALDVYLPNIKGYFSGMMQPMVLDLTDDAKYDYVVMTPIENTNWTVITFFNSSSLFSLEKFANLLWAVFVLLFVYVVTVSVVSKDLVFRPLARLVHSLKPATSFTSTQEIYGVERNDELGELAKTIQNLKKVLRGKNKELALTAQQADAANEAKSLFLAHMSHEMRTPMHAIIGMSKIAKNTVDLEKVQDCFSKIEASSASLLTIINNVLDMSKIEAQKIDVQLMPFNFHLMLQGVVNIIARSMDAKGLSFCQEFDANMPAYITSDEQRVLQVLGNLLSNAEKFTPRGGEVVLRTELVAHTDGQNAVRITVEDTGIGVAKDQQKNLFNPFQQANSTISHTFGGAGLGLSICKHVIELLQGEIFFHSAENEGMRIGFVLPFTLPPQEYIDKAQVDVLDAESLELRGKKFLLVDDIDINREIAMALLEDTGVSFDEAENGLQAVQKFSENPEAYDLILMDIRMPEMNGFEAAKAIRSMNLPHAKRIPIVAMTANAFREDIEQCLAAGMNAHVGKPIDFNELLITLRQCLQGKKI